MRIEDKRNGSKRHGRLGGLMAAASWLGLFCVATVAMAAGKVPTPGAAGSRSAAAKHVPTAVKPPVGAVRLPVLSYTIDTSGPATGAHPKRSDMITVNYRLTLLDGTEVDGSAKRGKPDVFPLGRLIPAWQILLQKMRPGDAWTFYVPPEYAYGATAKEGLPANSFLIFKVELLSFETPPSEVK